MLKPAGRAGDALGSLGGSRIRPGQCSKRHGCDIIASDGDNRKISHVQSRKSAVPNMEIP